MEFLQLKYFQHAAKTENFSHTAVAFMVPTSSISSSIKKLETELGTQLFNRSANKLSLNENGKQFLKTVDIIFSELEKSRNSMSYIGGLPAGKVNMLIITNRYLVIRKLAEFKKQYPNIDFSIDFGNDTNFNRYDLLITDTVIENDSFKKSDFIDEEIMLAVHKSNPLSCRKQVNMSMLSSEKFICLYPGQSLRNITDKLFLQSGISPEIIVECDDPQCVREFLKMGIGASLVPSVSWHNQLDPSISLIRINYGIYRNSKIYLNKNASPCAVAFASYIKNMI